MRAKLLLLIVTLNLILSPLTFANEVQKDHFTLSHNDHTLLVEIDAPGFVMDEEAIKDDYLFAANQENGMFFSLYFESANDKGGPEACRDQKWSKVEELSLDVRKVRNWRFKDMQFKNHTVVDEFNGTPFTQKHLLGCAVRADTWIVIHISKINYKSRDFKLFTNILRNIKISDFSKIKKAVKQGETKAPELKGSKSFEYLIKGNEYFTNQDYKKAIFYYRKAFNLEKSKRTFGELEWILLIDNFGVAYGITGDYQRAMDVFEYGIKHNPRYPMFYYNMACTYAEQGNLQKTLKYLSKAYLYRNNNLVGEQLPDPYEDDSFKPFVDNRDFKRIADRINQSRK